MSIRFEDLTEDQIKALSNGCGPMGLGWVVPDLVFDCPCSRHDVDYWVGTTRRDRYNADRRFLKGMLEHARKQKGWLRRIFYRFMSFRYYAGVRLLGSKCFYFGPPRTREELEKACV